MARARASRRPKPKPGNPSYAGYDYQVKVTVWVALELLLVKEACAELLIEAPSFEDIEARVRPGSASVSMRADDGAARLLIQIKSRSRSPWSGRDFAHVFHPRAAERSERVRRSPLQILGGDPAARYLFITNEALERSLRVFEVTDVLGTHDARHLPPFLPRNQNSPEDLAARILICAGLTPELLAARIARMLTEFGHVPLAHQGACVGALQEEVRRRLLGERDGRWHQQELIAVLRQHGGSLFASHAIAHFVPPLCFEAILARLDREHAVLIDGASGVGKTLTADVIEAQLRERSPPYRVITERGGPGAVREQLHVPGPVLFHLRDPWGANWLDAGADRWASELPVLLGERSSDRKFIITSRTDVLASAGHTLAAQLSPFVVTLRSEDYDETRMRRIFQSRLSGLSQAQAVIARSMEDKVLARLSRPYELDRFFIGLTQASEAGLVSDQLIARSQIEAISGVVADQIRTWSGGNGGVPCAAILWGVLRAAGDVDPIRIGRVSRIVRQLAPDLPLEIAGFIDFFCAGRNLRREPARLSFFHPRVEAGFRMALLRESGQAERTLSLLFRALGDAANAPWGTQISVELLRGLQFVPQLQPLIGTEIQRQIDEHLFLRLAQAAPEHFRYALQDLALFGSSVDAPAEVARSLCQLLALPIPSSGASPPLLSPGGPVAYPRIRDDRRVTELLKLAIVKLLPYTSTPRLVDVYGFFEAFAADLTGAWRSSIEAVVRDPLPRAHIPVLVRGAFAHASIEELDRFTDGLIASQTRALSEYVGSLSGSGEVPEQFSANAFCNFEIALDAVVSLRRTREGGLDWLFAHPHCGALLSCAASVLQADRNGPSESDLRALICAAIGHPEARVSIWDLAASYWYPALEGELDRWFCREDLAQSAVRETLLSISVKITPDREQWLAQMRERLDAAGVPRQLELITDILACEFVFPELHEAGNREEWHSRATELAATLSPPVAEAALALTAEVQEHAEVGRRLSEGAQQILLTHLPDASPWIARPATMILAEASVFSPDAIRSLLSTGKLEHSLAAIKALQVLPVRLVVAVWQECLSHAVPQVRQAAVAFAFRNRRLLNRAQILDASRDASALVRAEFVKGMSDRPWADAADRLVELLRDTGESLLGEVLRREVWPRYAVPRLAAWVLGQYDWLPDRITTRMFRVLEDPELLSPITRGNLLYALARFAAPQGCAAVLAALGSGDYENRLVTSAVLVELARTQQLTLTEELRQQLCSLALSSDEFVAAPVLVALGHLADRAREELVKTLRERTLMERIVLLMLAAAASGSRWKAIDRELLRGVTSREVAKPARSTPHRNQPFGNEIADATTFLARSLAGVPEAARAPFWLVRERVGELPKWTRAGMAGMILINSRETGEPYRMVDPGK